MKLPAKETNLGRVLRAMHGAGPMTSGDGKQCWLYRIDYMPRVIRDALYEEMSRRIAA
jgi:hypothetical protein